MNLNSQPRGTMSLIRNLARRAYTRLRQAFPINRVVALLTAPAAALAGTVATAIAKHAPFISVDEASLTAIFLAGAAAAVTAAYKWLDGWMQYEQALMELDADVIRAERAEARKIAKKAGRGR